MATAWSQSLVHHRTSQTRSGLLDLAHIEAQVNIYRAPDAQCAEHIRKDPSFLSAKTLPGAPVLLQLWLLISHLPAVVFLLFALPTAGRHIS